MRAARIIVAVLMLFGVAGEARADIIFSTAQGSVSPDENILFNLPGLIGGPALTVTGATNQTGIQVSFTGTENLLTPPQGQARITAVDPTGYNSLLIDAVNPLNFFSEFEANVRIFAQSPNGTAVITACNQFAVCEVFNLALASGENFFVLSVVSPQLINTVQITTDVAILDVRQVRVSIQGDDTTVPEPTLLTLMGAALFLGGRRFRNRYFRG
jgi:hypothetical protein